MPELNAAQIRVGQKVLISADAVPGASFEGNVYAIDPIVDINGRAIRLRARVPNRDGRLSPGFFARIRIVLEQRQDAVLMPESAIIPSDQKVLVYRVVNGRAVQTEVVLGQRLAGRWRSAAGCPPATPWSVPAINGCVKGPRSRLSRQKRTQHQRPVPHNEQ